jgi:DNA-binding CsgD family transcriptional regulator/N-acetylneuraminic acid mutarotase
MPESNDLSEREREILSLVAKGSSNKEIARDLHISTNTVKVHLRNIFTKFGVNSRTEAAMYAINTGIVEISGNGSTTSQQTEPQQSNRILLVGIGIFILLLILGIIGILAVRGTLDGNQAAANQPIFPEEQRWQDKAPMTEARKGLALAAYGGEIFAIAGETEQNITGLVERYDPNLDQWTRMESKPFPVTDVSAAVIGGKIYVPGGRTASGEVTDVLEIYSPIEDEWEKGAEIPTRLSAYAMVSYEGYLYLFGGWDGRQAVNSVYKYDQDSDYWRELTPMPTARAFPGVSIVEGKIFVIGGYDGEKALSTNERYIPDLEESKKSPWERGESLPNPRYAMGVASLADTIYVIGGESDRDEALGYIELSSQSSEWKDFGETFDTGWSHLGIVPVGTHFYLTGGELDGVLTNQNLAYQAIYLINLPVVR